MIHRPRAARPLQPSGSVCEALTRSLIEARAASIVRNVKFPPLRARLSRRAYAIDGLRSQAPRS